MNIFKHIWAQVIEEEKADKLAFQRAVALDHILEEAKKNKSLCRTKFLEARGYTFPWYRSPGAETRFIKENFSKEWWMVYYMRYYS